MKKIVLSLFALVMALSLRAQTVNVTFQVDMTNWLNVGGTINEVHAAGQFATYGSTTITSNWAPNFAGSKFNNTVDNVYALTVTFPDTSAGDSLQFKFLCDSAWSGTITPSTINNGQNSEGQTGFTSFINGEGCTVVGSGNRVIAIPASDALFTANWDECGTLTLTAVKNVNAPQVNSLYPNPANQKASLVYTTNTIGKVQIYLSNLVGQVVKTVMNTTQTAGVHTQAIDVSGLSNGVYFLTIKVNDQTVARKFNVMN